MTQLLIIPTIALILTALWSLWLAGDRHLRHLQAIAAHERRLREALSDPRGPEDDPQFMRGLQ